MLPRLVVGLLVLVSPLQALAQVRGVPQSGFPSWQERMLQVLFNRARADPLGDPKACSATTVRPALALTYNFNRSARFHSSNLNRTGCFQHNSPCLLFSDISSRFPPLGTCDGSASCACSNAAVCNSACTSTDCTQTFTRISMFGSSANGEIIAGGYGSPRAAHTGWMNSSGHCAIILGGAGSVGTGWYSNTWTGNFGGGTPSGTLIAGGHEVGTSNTQFIGATAQNVGFRVNYYNAGGAPLAAQVNVGGSCSGMTLERGGAGNGTYLATVSLSGTCHRYFFTFRDPGGATVVLPETGSYGVGSSLSGCPDWDAATPTACGVSDPPPTIATPAQASPSPVTGATTTASVLGADNGGEAALSYTWTASGPAAVSFSPNGNNAAKVSTATFTRAGSYTLTVNVRDVNGQAVASAVAVTVSQTLTSLTVTPAAATVTFNSTQQFAASGRDQFNQAMTTQPAITWSVSAGGTINGSGLFTAGSTAGGPHTVTASSGSLTGTASVTIGQGSPPAVVTAASASPNPTSTTSSNLSVLGADDGGEANLTYQWTATSGPAAVTFTPNGTNSAKSSTATFSRAGSYSLRVTLTDQSGQSAQSTVTVTVNQAFTTVGISPPDPSVAPGATLSFSAEAQDQFGAAMVNQPNNFSWNVSGGGTISNAGLFTAAASAGGPYTVTASAQGRSGTTQVTIASGSPPAVATAASAAPNPVTGTTTLVEVLGSDDGGEANLRYTWAATGPATVSFSPNGDNAAKSATATFTRAGSYTLTATLRDAGGLAATSAVTVEVQQTVTTVTVSPSSATLAPGGSQQFSATARDQFAIPLAVDPTFTWGVNGGGTVDATGLFLAGSTVGGPYLITASAAGQSGSASVSIAQGSPPAIAVAASATPNPVTGTTTQLAVTATDDGGEPALSYSWNATGPQPVSFSLNGSNAAKTTEATFTRAGLYALAVTVTDGDGLTAASSVSVTVEQSPSSLTVSPQTISVPVSGSQQFSVAAVDQFGSTMSATPAWNVSGGGAIDAAGLFTAGPSSGGPHTVTATAGAATGTAQVSIVELGLDTTPPQVALISPVAGASVSGAAVAVVAQASDDVGLERVEFLLDGAVIGGATAEPFELGWDTRAVANGSHTLAARATDQAGNADQTAPITISVNNDGAVEDVTAPTVLILSPADGATTSGPLEVVVEATDESGVASVHFLLDDVEVASATAEPYLARLFGVAPGEHTLVATAKDAAGNEGRSEEVRITARDIEGVRGSCNCASGGPGTWLLAAAALLGLSRRRRKAPSPVPGARAARE